VAAAPGDDNASIEALEEPRLQHHRLTVEQYRRMGETGVLERDARVELIEGELLDMTPIGTRHWAAVSRLNRLFVQAVGARAIVSIQSSIRLDRYSEPEPDLSLLKPRDDFYAGALPSGHDALLVVEVAEGSLAYDMRTKARLYATHGVAAYWVVDLGAAQLHLFAAPQAAAYGDARSTAAPGIVAVPGLDGCGVDLSGLF
jgi:Uma2 family endonuclease